MLVSLLARLAQADVQRSGPRLQQVAPSTPLELTAAAHLSPDHSVLGEFHSVAPSWVRLLVTVHRHADGGGYDWARVSLPSHCRPAYHSCGRHPWQREASGRQQRAPTPWCSPAERFKVSHRPPLPVQWAALARWPVRCGGVLSTLPGARTETRSRFRPHWLVVLPG